MPAQSAQSSQGGRQQPQRQNAGSKPAAQQPVSRVPQRKIKFENGEHGIYNIIANDNNIIFKPKFEITEKDVAEIPALKDLRDAIEKVDVYKRQLIYS